MDWGSADKALKWFYYSTYNPSWDPDVVLRDYHAKKSLIEAYKERDIPLPRELQEVTPEEGME